MSCHNNYTYLFNYNTPYGSIVYAQLFKGFFNGYAKETFSDDSEIEFEFSNGVREGKAFYYQSGRLLEVFWYHGNIPTGPIEESPFIANTAKFAEFVLQNAPITRPPHPPALTEGTITFQQEMDFRSIASYSSQRVVNFQFCALSSRIEKIASEEISSKSRIIKNDKEFKVALFLKIAEFAELPPTKHEKEQNITVRLENKLYKQFPQIKKKTWRTRICRIMGIQKADIKVLPREEDVSKLFARMKEILDNPNQMITRDIIYNLQNEFDPPMPIEFIGAEYLLHRGFLLWDRLYYYRNYYQTKA